VRFDLASQFGAGAFLNAIPTRAHFRLPSRVLRFALQRRFGLHLSMMTDVMADGIYASTICPLTPSATWRRTTARRATNQTRHINDQGGPPGPRRAATKVSMPWSVSPKYVLLAYWEKRERGLCSLSLLSKDWTPAWCIPRFRRKWPRQLK